VVYHSNEWSGNDDDDDNGGGGGGGDNSDSDSDVIISHPFTHSLACSLSR
jgi:hypothetical protein